MNRALLLASLSLVSLSGLGCSLTQSNFFTDPLGTAAKRSDIVERQLALARLSERHGQTDQATKMYLRIVEENPADQLAHHRLGVIAAKKGQFDQAMQHYQAAEQSGPASVELLGDIGYTLYLQHDLPAAEAKLRQVLEMDPNDKRARTNLGLVLGEQGRFDESYAEFGRASDESSALANLAYVQSQMGQLGDAESNYHRAITLDTKNRRAAEALVQVAARTGALQNPAPLEKPGRQMNAPSMVAELKPQPQSKRAAAAHPQYPVTQASADQPSRETEARPSAMPHSGTRVANGDLRFADLYRSHAVRADYQSPILTNRDTGLAAIRSKQQEAQQAMPHNSVSQTNASGGAFGDIYQPGMQSTASGMTARITDSPDE